MNTPTVFLQKGRERKAVRKSLTPTYSNFVLNIFTEKKKKRSQNYKCIWVYRPTVLQRVEPLLCDNRLANIPEPFQGNDSVNTFPQQRIDTQQ
jgi:hypothetical protein